MNLNRDLQWQILQALRDKYPHKGIIKELVAASDHDIDFNFCYLVGHGLVEGGTYEREPLGEVHVDGWAAITARGLDFLEDDGGLSAILGVVTVRLESETLKQLIAARVDTSDASDEQKSWIKSQVSQLPETALKAATNYLVQMGLKNLPALKLLLETLNIHGHGL